MDKRRAALLKGITKGMCGLEIAPWFAPIAPKAEGFDVKILDLFPTERLRAGALADPNIPEGAEDNIEEVDFVGNASDIATLARGSYDYVISSHNFEHLPDPIRFLQGVETLLNRDGQLIMALPDCRFTFDRYRPHSTIGDWIEAHREGRTAPTPRQAFEFFSYLGENETPKLVGDLLDSRRFWDDRDPPNVHCSLFFPTSFELLILEARALGYIALEVVRIIPNGGEFFVWLKPASGEIDDLQARREQLLRRIRRDMGRQPHPLIVRATQIANRYLQ